MGHTKVWWVNIFGTDLGVPKKNMTISPKNVIDRFYKIKIKTWKENYIIFSEKGNHEIYDETLEYAKTSDHEIYILGGHGKPNNELISNSLPGNKNLKLDSMDVFRRLKELGFKPEKSFADIKLASCYSGVGGYDNSIAGRFREVIDNHCFDKIGKGYGGKIYGYTEKLKFGYNELNDNLGCHKWSKSIKKYACGCILYKLEFKKWSHYRKEFPSNPETIKKLTNKRKEEDIIDKELLKIYNEPQKDMKLLLVEKTVKLLEKQVKLLEENNSLLKKEIDIKNPLKKREEVTI